MPDGDPIRDGWLPGDYGQHRGTWYGVCPEGSMANLGAHDVTEHDDGAITVSPSILISEGASRRECWHGWLERGVWRSC